MSYIWRNFRVQYRVKYRVIFDCNMSRVYSEMMTMMMMMMMMMMMIWWWWWWWWWCCFINDDDYDNDDDDDDDDDDDGDNGDMESQVRINPIIMIELQISLIIPPASTKLKGGYTGITLSVCPSVRLWTELCPLCIFNNTHRIHFIFAHLIKQLQKVCRV